MGLINYFRSKFNNKFEGVKLVEDRGNGFYCWNGVLYKSDTIRACIRPKVNSIKKLVPQHIRDDQVNGGLAINPEPYIKYLLMYPNPYMKGSDLLEKLINQLSMNNNAFALVVRDEFNLPSQIYPINAVGVEAVYNTLGDLFYKFTMENGKIMTFSINDVIHLRQDFDENDVFGTSPRDSLKPLMEIVSTSDQGIVNAIKNGAVIRWLLRFTGSLRPEDIEKNTNDFVNQFMNTSNSMGAAGVDSKCDAQQIDPKDYVPNAAQTDRTITRIYNFFNTNEKIVQSKYNEDEWNAYYESQIEPLVIQLSEEFTRVLFNRKQIAFGNKIIFNANNLMYASMSTKLGLVQFIDRGIMTPNEVREILNMPHIDGGDNVLLRKDTGVVSEGGDS